MEGFGSAVARLGRSAACDGRFFNQARRMVAHVKATRSLQRTVMRHHCRRWMMGRTGAPVLVLASAAAIGAVVGVAPAMRASPGTASHGEPLSGCTTTDGDTIRCGGERIRLLGIDAPELPGHCREGRDCAPGDPYASTASPSNAMTGQLTITRVGEDHYGRTLALVASDKGDVSCWQLAHAQAIYKENWDNELRVARTCPGAIG